MDRGGRRGYGLAPWYIAAMPRSVASQRAYLIRVAGPAIGELLLTPDHSPLTLGRHEHCDICTPVEEERISRYHAQFTCDGSRWYLSDLRSTWGTYLNGYRLPPDKPHALSEGDLIRLTPWTFSYRHARSSAQAISSSDDLEQAVTAIRSLAPSERSALGDPMVMLVEAAAGVHQAADEMTLARLVLDFARRGMGYSNAAYLRPSDADGRIEVVASSPERTDGVYSRSLLMAASGGEIAILDPMHAPASQSAVMLQIRSGLCAPLMLGQAVAAYLYLDSRSVQGQQSTHPRAPEFCLALARIASLALANLKRIDIERRQAALDSQLEQAAAMQRYILPPSVQEVAGLRVMGESRPGQLLGGDFLDVIPLDEHRVALTIGDVSGKGIAASVLMTTIHGFLHATLAGNMPLEVAVGRLNSFLEPRRPEGSFATLFAAVVDTAAGTITYVDAGHGYGMLWHEGRLVPLQAAGGPPLGVFADQPYAAEMVQFPAGAMLVAVSDGIIEQPALVSPDGHRQQFELAGLEETLRDCADSGDEIGRVFAAVQQHAGTRILADDATILLARRL